MGVSAITLPVVRSCVLADQCASLGTTGRAGLLGVGGIKWVKWLSGGKRGSTTEHVLHRLPTTVVYRVSVCASLRGEKGGCCACTRAGYYKWKLVSVCPRGRSQLSVLDAFAVIHEKMQEFSVHLNTRLWQKRRKMPWWHSRIEISSFVGYALTEKDCMSLAAGLLLTMERT